MGKKFGVEEWVIVDSSMPNFTPIGAGVGRGAPKTENSVSGQFLQWLTI